MPVKINIPMYSSYVDGVRVGAVYAPALAQQLSSRAPEDLSPSGKKAIRLVASIGAEVKRIRGDRVVVGAPRPGELRNVVMASMTATYNALSSKAELGDPGADRIIGLRDRYLGETRGARPDGMALWTIATGALETIDAEEAGAEIDALIGPEFLSSLRKRTLALGAAIGIGRQAVEAPDTTAMRDALWRFSRATSRYCRVLVAEVDEDDAASVSRFVRAVGPIDEYRASMRGSGASEAANEPPREEEPAPVVDEEPREGGLTPVA